MRAAGLRASSPSRTAPSSAARNTVYQWVGIGILLGPLWIRSESVIAMRRATGAQCTPTSSFFNKIQGKVRASIVDPHGHHLEDSLVKLQGLAKFAEEYGDEFHRVEAVTKIGTKMRVLDLKSAEVRDAVNSEKRSVTALYESSAGADYHLR
jgi:hypothetical protein